MATATNPWQTNPYLAAATSTIAAPANTAAPGVGITLPTGAPNFGSTNPFSTVSNVKSPETDQRLKELFDLLTQSVKSGSGALADYKTAVDQATPQVQGQTSSDIANIDQLFNGTDEQKLAAIREYRKKAMAGVASRSLGDVGRLLSSTALGSASGGRAPGASSYLTKLGLDKAADINAAAAADDATQQRGDFMDLLQRRLQATGTRQSLTDTLAGRTLLPYKAETERLGALTGALGNLSSIDLLNKFYGLKADQSAFAT